VYIYIYICIFIRTDENLSPRTFEKMTKRRKILDKIQQKKDNLFELKRMNSLESTGNEGTIFNDIFNNRDRDMISAEIIVQEDVLSMVENVVAEIMTVVDDENEVSVSDGIDMIPVVEKVKGEKILEKIRQNKNGLKELKNTEIFASTGVKGKKSVQDVVMMIRSVITDVEVENDDILRSYDAAGDEAVEVIQGGGRGRVVTCEIDKSAADMAQKYFDMSSNGKQIELYRMKGVELLDRMREEGRTFDLVFIDADKKLYKEYLQNLMGILHHEEDEKVIGKELEVENKRNSCLLDDNALIIVDNTLWKGLVLEEVSGHMKKSYEHV
jgi:16S rRNA G966 N2-methylase RsmD